MQSMGDPIGKCRTCGERLITVWRGVVIAPDQHRARAAERIAQDWFDDHALHINYARFAMADPQQQPRWCSTCEDVFLTCERCLRELGKSSYSTNPVEANLMWERDAMEGWRRPISYPLGTFLCRECHEELTTERDERILKKKQVAWMRWIAAGTVVVIFVAVVALSRA